MLLAPEGSLPWSISHLLEPSSDILASDEQDSYGKEEDATDEHRDRAANLL